MKVFSSLRSGVTSEGPSEGSLRCRRLSLFLLSLTAPQAVARSRAEAFRGLVVSQL